MLRYDTASRVWRDRPGTGAIARLLLQAGAPLDGSPGDAQTPLITAASYGDAEVARVLIEAGADLDATDPWDRQPLRQAAMNGRVAAVEHLLARGADPNHRDGTHHRTALDWCRRRQHAGDSPRHAQVKAILGPVTERREPPAESAS